MIMKKLFFICSISLLAVACSGKKSPAEIVGYKTTMKVASTFNAGKIARGEMIHAKLEVENTGEYPLVLSDVSGSCSCTVADWSKDPIAPGEKGFVKADINTESFSEGEVARSVTILSNTTPPNTKVVIQATIIK
jgi:hypothetical protein